MRILDEDIRRTLNGRVNDTVVELALSYCRHFGTEYRYSIWNIFLHAIEKRRLPAVFDAFENYFKVHQTPLPLIIDKATLAEQRKAASLFLERDVMDDILGLKKAAGWPVPAKRFLKRFYRAHKACTTEQKIALHIRMQGEAFISSATGSITREQVLAVYEYDLLDRAGIIEPVYM